LPIALKKIGLTNFMGGDEPIRQNSFSSFSSGNPNVRGYDGKLGPHQTFIYAPGLPDISLYILPKPENVPNQYKM
jgi:hypothetical protein